MLNNVLLHNGWMKDQKKIYVSLWLNLYPFQTINAGCGCWDTNFFVTYACRQVLSYKHLHISVFISKTSVFPSATRRQRETELCPYIIFTIFGLKISFPHKFTYSWLLKLQMTKNKFSTNSLRMRAYQMKHNSST